MPSTIINNLVSQYNVSPFIYDNIMLLHFEVTVTRDILHFNLKQFLNDDPYEFKHFLNRLFDVP